MIRRVLALALALQLMLPAHVVESLLAATAAEPASQVDSKVCLCTGKVGCKCCGCDEEPDMKASNSKSNPTSDPGPHGAIQCDCAKVHSLAMPVVYLPVRGPMFQSLAQPREERLLVRSDRWLSPALPIDSPPPKI
jgi:hypothetical protein